MINISAAAYKYSYSNLQLQSFDPSQGALVVTLANAAEAKVEGLEFDASARLGSHVTVNTGLSYMPTAKYSKYLNAPVFVPLPNGGNATVMRDISGSRMIRAPKLTFFTGLSARTELAGGELEGAVNAAYNSGFYWQPGETARQGNYTLLNANISWASPDRKYKVTVYGSNLLNEAYGIYQAQTAVGDSIALGRPRTVGVRLDVEIQ